MPKPPTVTLEQVERVAPYGAFREPDGTYSPARQIYTYAVGQAMLRFQEGSMPTPDLTPMEIVERLRVVECNNCDGRGTMPPPAWQEPYTPSPKGESQCLRCAGTGYIDPDPQLRGLVVDQ